MRGGSDRSELRPLHPDGNIDHDLAGHEVVGNHKGQYAAYNIVDPAPGTVHQYANRADVLGCRQRGWWVARPEDGRPAYQVGTLYQTQPDVPLTPDEAPFAGMVHMVTSEENFRRLMDEQVELRRAQLGPAGLSFLEGANDDPALVRRFVTKDHVIETLDERGRVVDQLTPRGIAREEGI